ncbi:MAG: linear amide C-N hydrolase [Acidobacteria bacterium]|nr:linear amide C-N hydrolase [Acidobacteriota bacterium]MBU4307226.1 linear amide C-N hydrolase [Acidobacteriota bacterium]MBU4405018.1 linear amide C-N hydrolase [Acidobacteriota bacterium]MCG2811461.1 linear amide C-N hydrolase [Candidatus Aminicenantes bacterium]
MKSKIQFVICLAVLAGLFSLDSDACTTFSLKDRNKQPLFGRNFDFPAGQGQIHINQRNRQKTSMIAAPEKPFTWTSRYGSISFNQNGREFPYGGMNEAGLVIEQMMHESADSQYPPQDDRHGLEELQWIQYQLDVSASVADVIASDRAVRISFTSVAPLHFLAADANGDVAAIEYINGQMVVHAGQDLKYPVLANDTYDASLAIKASLDAAGGNGHPDRFARAAGMVEAFNPNSGPALEYAFDILKNVSQGGTQWSIVYDLKKKAIFYRTRTNSRIRRITMDMFDFSCAAAGLFADIEADDCAAADFKTSTYESNLKLIGDVWSSVEFLKALPQEMRIAWAKFPATTTCSKK